MTEFKNQKVLVIGLGLSGRAAAQFLIKKGAIVWGVDRDPNLFLKTESQELIQCGLIAKIEPEDIEIHLFDSVVVSPGIPPTNPYYAAAVHAGIEIIGEIDLACRYIDQPFLAITGTNGKTTTTLLTTHILNHSGKQAQAVGNVGTPLIQELDSNGTKNRILVVELSSFQLETLNKKIVDAGVILNITPDHLDRYTDMQTYAAAKIHLKNCMKPTGKLYVFEKTYHEYRELFHDSKPGLYGYSPESQFYTDQESIYFQKNIELTLPANYQGSKSHDVENLLASYILCKQMGVSPEQFIEATETFRKPLHRLEFVRTFKGISYYDDSKGTNIDAVIRAVNALKGEIILIAGGIDKGAAYTPWINDFDGRVKHVFAIGQAAPKIKQDLSKSFPVELCSTLEIAIKNATSLAKPGQVILLSPGCSSFDMFRDYAHRGEEFKRIVNAL